MQLRGTLGALVLASLFALPSVASSAIVQKWGSISNYYVISPINDLNNDNSFEMLTVEPGSGGGVKIGVRSTSTGALLAQTTGSYQPDEFWITYLEPTNGIAEVVFLEHSTGNLVCLNYVNGPTVSVRWSFKPVPTLWPTTWTFADLDGTGQLYMVFKDPAPSTTKFYVYNNSGTLVSTIDLTTTAPAGTGWTTSLSVDDYDNDGRQEFLIDDHNSGGMTPQDFLYMYESNAPAPQAPASAPPSAQHAQRLVRKFERVEGDWSEVKSATPDAPAASAVRLP